MQLLHAKMPTQRVTTDPLSDQLFKGTPLIEEDYLLNKTDPHARRNLAAYRHLLKDTLAVLADPSLDTDRQATEMIDFEIEFAKVGFH